MLVCPCSGPEWSGVSSYPDSRAGLCRYTSAFHLKRLTFLRSVSWDNILKNTFLLNASNIVTIDQIWILQRRLAFIWKQMIAQPAAASYTFCLYVYSTLKQVWSIAK